VIHLQDRSVTTYGHGAGMMLLAPVSAILVMGVSLQCCLTFKETDSQ
jgi:hypothetical protein